MAIYHCSIQNISRSDGRSIVACAAYRAGEKLECDTYGKMQDYTKKSGIEYTQIFAPDGVNPDLLDRQVLWNRVEQAELKKDGSIKQEARLAKEIEIALPHELNKQQRQTLVTELCQSLVKGHGVAVDVAIHSPHTAGGSDDRNFHAHILMTTRTATGQGLGGKVRELDRHSTLKKIRQEVADLTNRHLAAAGFDLTVDHRSHKDRGLDIEPTIKEGTDATHAKRRGLEMEIVKRNDEIKQRNLNAESLDMSIFDTQNTLEQLQQQQLESAVDEAPAVYAKAQQALYEHQQQRQVLLDHYMQSRAGDTDKVAEHRFYSALQSDRDRLQLDRMVREGEEAEALLREIGEPLPPPVKAKKGWFSAEYHCFDDMLKLYNADQSNLSVYQNEIKEQQHEQQRQQKQEKLQAEQQAERKQADEKERQQNYELYLSKFGYVEDAEYDHVSDRIGPHLSTYTRLQAYAYADRDLQTFIKNSRKKYEHISELIRYERDIEIIKQVGLILDKDKHAIEKISPQLMTHYEQMQDVFHQRKNALENAQRPTYRPSYDYEQPKPTKGNDFNFD